MRAEGGQQLVVVLFTDCCTCRCRCPYNTLPAVAVHVVSLQTSVLAGGVIDLCWIAVGGSRPVLGHSLG